MGKKAKGEVIAPFLHGEMLHALVVKYDVKMLALPEGWRSDLRKGLRTRTYNHAEPQLHRVKSKPVS